IALIGYDVLISADATGNLAAPMLAREVGGDFLLAFISAIAFTTIVAVVAGLAISATTVFSHDVYHHIIKKGISSEKYQLLAARWSAFGIDIIATLFALKLENINVTFLVSLTFFVASASIFQVFFLTIYCKKFIQMCVLKVMVLVIVNSLLFAEYEPLIMY